VSARPIDRRDLFRWSVSAAGGLALAGCGRASAPRAAAGAPVRGGLVLGPGKEADERGNERYALALLDLDADLSEPVVISTSFFGHGLAIDPTDPGRAVLFEKRGPGACEIDLRACAVTRPIVSPAGREFYGHGAFAPDGALLYATETVVADYHRGVTVVRDGRTLEELGEFPTYGAAPHDCVLRDEGRTLVFTNGGSDEPGGSAPCVTYVDAQSEKLIEKVELDGETLNAGHLALSSRGDLAVVSAMREYMPRESLGGASLRPAGGVLRALREPRATTSRMIGETLSVAIHEPTERFGATNPLGNLVTFWGLADGGLLGELALSNPRGIALTLDGAQFVVSYGRGASLVRVDPASLEPIPGTRVAATRMGGSHIVVHDLA
jgi:hypothetical protein